MVKKRGLGKSLDALLAYTQTGQHIELTSQETNGQQLSAMSIELLQRGKYQPRRDMDPEALNELANSIKAQGILQPLIVRPLSEKSDHYEIIAGERRFRAAKLAGLQEVPVIIRHIPDEAAIAIALIENIQRENLNPIEEAVALEQLIHEFKMTHQEVAEAVGKSRTNVTNLLRLLTLPSSIKTLLEQGLIEMGHARTLITLPESLQLQAAKAIMEHSLSVRDTEEWVKRAQLEKTSSGKSENSHFPELKRLEEQLAKRLKLKVAIKGLTSGKGRLVIHYKSAAELDYLLKQFEESVV